MDVSGDDNYPPGSAAGTEEPRPPIRQMAAPGTLPEPVRLLSQSAFYFLVYQKLMKAFAFRWTPTRSLATLGLACRLPALPSTPSVPVTKSASSKPDPRDSKTHQPSPSGPRTDSTTLRPSPPPGASAKQPLPPPSFPFPSAPNLLLPHSRLSLEDPHLFILPILLHSSCGGRGPTRNSSAVEESLGSRVVLALSFSVLPLSISCVAGWAKKKRWELGLYLQQRRRAPGKRKGKKYNPLAPPPAKIIPNTTRPRHAPQFTCSP